jgi:hypothetical protein
MTFILTLPVLRLLCLLCLFAANIDPHLALMAHNVESELYLISDPHHTMKR